MLDIVLYENIRFDNYKVSDYPMRNSKNYEV